MELGDTSNKEASPPQVKKREMSKNRWIQMVPMLQMMEMEDGMRRGAFTIVAKCFGMARLMVHCLWNRVTCTHASGHIISLEFHSHKKNCRRRPMYLSEFVCEGIKDIPLWNQRTQRKLVTSMGVSKTMVRRWIVDSTIQVHSNSLKPVLMEENKMARLFMALDSWDPQDPMKFLNMMDQIHVEEKWFFLSQQRRDSSFCRRRRTLSGV